ncbi:MAG: hypothetical protein WCF67_04970 [Chitinophagaceae bacterium]
MKLRGGVVIIGSLLWEDHLEPNKKDNVRLNWRNRYLSSVDQSILTKVPIRYGRQSSTRQDTYTMVFSSFCNTRLGQGRILPFSEDIKSFEDLERQAIALAIAEGIYKEGNKRLTSNWGSVALLLNPELSRTDPAAFELIEQRWAEIYKSYSQTFVSNNYKVKEESQSSITPSGLLNITWQTQMNNFDILIGTTVVPKPKIVLTPKQIYDKINETGYVKYFRENRQNGIHTYQDNDIEVGITVDKR